MGASDTERRPPSSSTRLRVAITACLAIVLVLVAALAFRTFATRDDTDRGDEVVKIDETTGATASRSGAPDVDAMLDTVIREADGTTTSLRDQLGERPLVVNLWSRTCIPCIREMPWLESVHVDDDRIEVIGVNQQDQLGSARELADEAGVTYRWFLDGAGDVGYHGRSVGLPDTYLIDTDGTLLAAKLGVFDDEAHLRSWIDEHLGSG